RVVLLLVVIVVDKRTRQRTDAVFPGGDRARQCGDCRVALRLQLRRFSDERNSADEQTTTHDRHRDRTTKPERRSSHEHPQSEVPKPRAGHDTPLAIPARMGLGAVFSADLGKQLQLRTIELTSAPMSHADDAPWRILRAVLIASGFAGCGDNIVPVGPPLEHSDTLFLGAHNDDDFIFMEPDLEARLASGSSTTIYATTAGPDGPNLTLMEAAK